MIKSFKNKEYDKIVKILIIKAKEEIQIINYIYVQI